MTIIRELHTRLSRPTWREIAKADKWSRPLAPIVGVGFMEEIRTIISDASRPPFARSPSFASAGGASTNAAATEVLTGGAGRFAF